MQAEDEVEVSLTQGHPGDAGNHEESGMEEAQGLVMGLGPGRRGI